MYIDSEYGFSKKYLEYKVDDNIWSTSDFVLKFNICQNDKACQTELDAVNGDNGEDVVLKQDEEKIAVVNRKVEFFFPDDDFAADSYFGNDCRPSSVMGEILWSREPKHCEKCNNKTTAWSMTTDKFDIWQKQTSDDIWNGGDVCLSCLSGNTQPLNQQQTQLREDVSHDGEQLLSDLSRYVQDLPGVEFACEMIEAKDRKRRHSNFYEDINWSFASRLKEDCFIQMSALPTLRSVTL